MHFFSSNATEPSSVRAVDGCSPHPRPRALDKPRSNSNPVPERSAHRRAERGTERQAISPKLQPTYVTGIETQHYLPLERCRTLFAEPACCIAGAYAPFGRGEPVHGGYRVSGKWGWASGVDQARWMVLGFSVAGSSSSPQASPEVRQAIAPRDAFRVLDSWHVSGLRATGSTEYEVRELFVAAEDTFRVFLDEPRHPAPIFRMPGVFFAAAVAAVPLGIASRTVDDLKQLALSRRPYPGRAAMRDQSAAQYAVAKAEALAESSRGHLLDSLSDVWDCVSEGERVDTELRVRARRASVHAAETSADAVDLCCRAAGGHALFQDQPFERALRDVRAAIAHIVLQPSALEDAGRVAFGLEPRSPTF